MATSSPPSVPDATGISGELALSGAIVAGTGGNPSALAFRILEAAYQLQIPHMSAALAQVSVTRVAIFLLLTGLSHLLLRRWHEKSTGRGDAR